MAEARRCTLETTAVGNNRRLIDRCCGAARGGRLGALRWLRPPGGVSLYSGRGFQRVYSQQLTHVNSGMIAKWVGYASQYVGSRLTALLSWPCLFWLKRWVQPSKQPVVATAVFACAFLHSLCRSLFKKPM